MFQPSFFGGLIGRSSHSAIYVKAYPLESVLRMNLNFISDFKKSYGGALLEAFKTHNTFRFGTPFCTLHSCDATLRAKGISFDVPSFWLNKALASSKRVCMPKLQYNALATSYSYHKWETKNKNSLCAFVARANSILSLLQVIVKLSGKTITYWVVPNVPYLEHVNEHMGGIGVITAANADATKSADCIHHITQDNLASKASYWLKYSDFHFWVTNAVVFYSNTKMADNTISNLYCAPHYDMPNAAYERNVYILENLVHGSGAKEAQKLIDIKDCAAVRCNQVDLLKYLLQYENASSGERKSAPRAGDIPPPLLSWSDELWYLV